MNGRRGGNGCAGNGRKDDRGDVAGTVQGKGPRFSLGVFVDLWDSPTPGKIFLWGDKLNRTTKKAFLTC